MTDFRKVMKLSNIFKYYYWSLKQNLYWHNVHKPIGDWLKKYTNLNNAPYLGETKPKLQQIKEKKELMNFINNSNKEELQTFIKRKFGLC